LSGDGYYGHTASLGFLKKTPADAGRRTGRGVFIGYLQGSNGFFHDQPK